MRNSTSLQNVDAGVVAWLAKYGLNTLDNSASELAQNKFAPTLQLSVIGHSLSDDGTRFYDVVCKLAPVESCSLEWCASKQLAELRESLHKVVIAEVGTGPFQDTPFAIWGGPVGTTGRLDNWCKTLASLINSRKCSSNLVRSVLGFLEVPEPPKSFARICRDGALKLDIMNDGSWKLYGMHVDSVVKQGLEYLDCLWNGLEAITDVDSAQVDGVDSNRMRLDSLLSKLSLDKDAEELLSNSDIIRGLIKGNVDLPSLSSDDIDAVTKDLYYLSVYQLIRMRVHLLDCAALQRTNEATFMSSLDFLLFQRIGMHALKLNASSAASVNGLALHENEDAKTWHLFGIHIVLFVAASEASAKSHEDELPSTVWVCGLGSQQYFFDAIQFECTSVFPDTIGALLPEFKSRPDAKSSSRRLWLEWNVQHVFQESDLAEIKVPNLEKISSPELLLQSGDIPLVNETAIERDKGVSVKLSAGKDVTETSDQINYVLASILTPSDVSELRQPSDLVCVIDVSGSMGSEATIQSASGTTESHGLTLLDVAKHGVRTIIKTLGALDRLAIVSFNHGANVVLSLTRMDEEGQTQAEEALDTLAAGGGTNIWHGLKSGLDSLREQMSKKGRFGHVMLLTDGESMERESIKPNLMRYKETYERLPGTINTFGFGYNLDSKLLVDLAETGSGSYSFIPDAGFVGTAFVNTMSNLLATMAREVYLTLSVECDAVIVDNAVMGGYPTQVLSDSIRVNLGTLQYGQTKDIVVPMKILDVTSSFLIAQVQYETRCGDIENSPCAETDGKDFLVDAVERQRCRCIFADTLPKVVETAKQQSCPEALTLLNTAIAEVRNTVVRDDDVVQALLEDMEGQSTEAVSKPEWFQKWGRHYLPSVMFAHRLQQCNNFKDPGVQVYGGTLYGDIRDMADEVFNQLPAPKPSARRSSMAGYRHSVAVAPAAPTSMAAYNDRYAG